MFLAVVGLALCATARDRGGASFLARTGAGIGVVAALLAIWQGCIGLSSQARAAESLSGPLRELILARLGSGRVFGPFLLPASLGGALAITLPLTVALAIAASGRCRLVWAAGALAQLAALVWSISLGAWIALAAGSAIALLGTLVRGPRGRRVLVGGLTLAALLVAAGVFARSFLLPAPGPRDRPLSYRTGNWVVAGEIVREHPLFGTGPGTFGEMFPAYRREGMNESRYAHCTYLQLVAELGVGILPFLALVPVAAAALVRRGASGGAVGVAASIGALSFLVHNLVDFTFYQPAVGALFVLAVAIAVGGGGHEAVREGEWPAAAALRPRETRWSAGPIVVLAASVAAGLVLIGTGLSDLAHEGAAFAREVGSAREIPLLARAIRFDRYDPDPRGDLASLLAERALANGGERSGTLGEALAQARTAARLDPQTAFRRHELARIELMRGHPAAAWVELSRAASLYPLKGDYRQDLASLEEKLFARRASGTQRRPLVGAAESPEVGR